MSNLLDSGPQRNVRSLLPALSNIDFALNAADRGFVPFPLEVNSAEPAFDEGDALATKSKVMLRHWWDENPKYNIGFSLENLLTLRINSARCASSTLTLLGALLFERMAPSSVKTTRIVSDAPAAVVEVCLHFLLPDGATVEARSDVLFEGVDVLSSDDFVVGPGSMIDGYLCKFVGDNALSLAPPWLLEACGVQLADHGEEIRPIATAVETVAPSTVTEEIAAADAAPLAATAEAAALPTESKTVTNVVPLKKAASPGAVKTKLDWALEAAAYIPVHPIRWYVDPGPNASPEERLKAAKAAKAALLTDWPNRATQDQKQIRELWRQYPDANIGGATNNFIVVDIDNRNGGDETFAGLLAAEYDFPETVTTRTQGGGRHLIYVAPDGPVKGGTHRLGLGIDVKAAGGYVLMPGSSIEGRMYTRENSRPAAFAPQWIVDQLKAAKPKTSAAGKRLVEEDDTARELFEQWIADHAPHAPFGEIDDKTYIVAVRGFDYGCGLATVIEIVTGWNETHCAGLGDAERLLEVCESASHNRENAIGSKHPLAPGFEAHAIAERPAPKPAAPASTGLATPLLQFDPVGLELRPWVIPGFACRGRVTLLAGPGGVAKSTYYLMVAIATVSGRGDICGFPILKRERVWVWNQEDDIAEMQRRVAAIMQAFNVTWEDLKDKNGEPMLFLDSGVDKPLMLANRSAEHSIVAGKQVADVIATAKANRIAVLILDPLVEFHEASENDNVQMRAMVGQVRRIAVEAIAPPCSQLTPGSRQWRPLTVLQARWMRPGAPVRSSA